MPFMKLFIVVNLAKITSTGLLGMTKDMLSNRDVAVFEFAFFRSISNLIISAIIIKSQLKKPLWGGFPQKFRGTMAIRSFCGAIDFLCITTAPKFLPLGIQTVITNCILFTVSLVACCWIGERVTGFEVAAMCLSMVGIALIGYS